MNHSGDAAEQMVRLSLEGVEVAAKIAGDGAKNIAMFLYAALKNRDKNQLKGKARLTSMLKSGKELKVFAVKESDLKKFAQEAKRYGVVYCVLRDRKGSADGLCDIMVRAEDASKINRIVERFDFAAVDSATIKSEIVQAKNNMSAKDDSPEAPVIPDRNDTDALLDELMPDEGKPEKQPTERENFNSATTEKSRPSEPISKNKETSEKTTSLNGEPEKKSVKDFLTEAAARRKQEEKQKRDEPRSDGEKPKPSQKQNRHKQPQNNKRKPRVQKPKSKEERP